MNPFDMKYTPTPISISAAEVYKKIIHIPIPEEYKVIDFRPIERGDLYWSDLAQVFKSEGDYAEPRFILKRERTDTERIEGILKAYRYNCDLGSREDIDRMLDREGI